MSELDQRLLDGIRLTGDAFHAGRLEAFQETCAILAEDLEAWRDRLSSAALPEEQARARGVIEAIERVLRAIDSRIEGVEAERGA